MAATVAKKVERNIIIAPFPLRYSGSNVASLQHDFDFFNGNFLAKIVDILYTANREKHSVGSLWRATTRLTTEVRTINKLKDRFQTSEAVFWRAFKAFA